MGTYAISKGLATPSDVMGQVTVWLEAAHQKVSELLHPTPVIPVHEGSEGKTFEARNPFLVHRWRLSSEKREHFLRYDIHLAPAGLLALAGIYFLALLGMSRVIASLPDITKQTGSQLIFAWQQIRLGGLAFAVLFFVVLLYLRALSREMERDLWKRLSDEFGSKARVVFKPEGEIAPDILVYLALYILISLIVYCFVRLGLHFLAGVALFLCIYSAITALAELSVKHSPMNRWKFSIFMQSYRLTTLVQAPLFFLVLLAFLNCLLVGLALAAADGDLTRQEIAGILRSDPFAAEYFARPSENYVDENLRIMASAFQDAERLVMIWWNSKLGLSFLLATAVLLLYVNLGRVMIRSQIETAPVEDMQPVTPDSWMSEAVKLRFFQALVALQFLICSGIFLGMAVLSIDALSFVSSGTTLIVEQVGVILGWLFLPPSQQWGLEDHGIVAWIIQANRIMCVLLFAPFALWVAFKLLYLFACKFRQLRLRLSWRRSESLQRRVDCMARKLDLPSPEVRIIRSRSSGNVSMIQPLFRRKPVLKIGSADVELYSEQELQAVIAHELGHTEHNLRVISLAKLASALSPFSNNFLTLAVDTSRMEIEADRKALKAVDRLALQAAIIKANSPQITAISMEDAAKQSLWKKIWRIPNQLRLTCNLHFTDQIIGYTHPSVARTRLAALVMEGSEHGR